MKKIYYTLLMSFFVANALYLVFRMSSAKIPLKPELPLTSQKEESKNDPLPMPIEGFCAEGFQDFDRAMISFLAARGFKCATLAIIKDGKFLAQRGYGWSNREKTKATQPNDYLRIGSLSKIFTAIAIKLLIQHKKISYQTPALDYLGQFKNLLDPQMKQITIFHLLHHQGGWDADRTIDPLFALGLTTDTLNKDITALTPKDVLKYVIENVNLDSAPGMDVKYSNIGYLILGRIIEKASGQNYVNFINNVLCAPVNAHVEGGPSKLSRKNPLEIEYYKSNDIDLDNNSISLKAADSSFGLITCAPDLCKILDKYWIDGDRKNAGERRQLVKTGTLPGTMALARQRYSGATIVVLINSRDNNNPEMDNNALKQLIDNTANRCGI